MVKKKTGSGKRNDRRASLTDEDVPVATSLPPKIDGHLRCYLKVRVPLITWLVPNAPEITHVRLVFWGEDGKGALFRPEDGRQQIRLLSRTSARYSVRSGPKQFVEYLNDMGSLVFEVLSGAKMVLVGRAQVNNVGSLTASNPITGVFPVLSADAEKVAALKVSITLESIMSSYDGASSIPTPDPSLDLYGGGDYNKPPINAPRVIPAPHDFQSDSATNGEGGLQSTVVLKTASGRVTPSGVDAQLFSNSGRRTPSADVFPPPFPANGGAPPGVLQAERHVSSAFGPEYRLSQTATTGRVTSGEKKSVSPKSRTQVIRPSERGSPGRRSQMATEGARAAQKMAEQKPGSQDVDGAQEKDLLATLLAKGSKLRNEMIISALDPVSGNKDVGPLAAKLGLDPLSFDPSLDVLPSDLLTPRHKPVDSDPSDADDSMLDFLTGNDFKAIQTLADSPLLSVSDDDPHQLLSDGDDLINDSKILDDLIYKSDSEDDSALIAMNGISPPRRRRSRSSGSIGSLLDAGNLRPPSRNSSGSGRNTPVKLPPSPKSKVRRKSPQTPPGKSRKSAKGQLRKKTKRKELRSKRDESDSDATNVSLRSEGSKVSFDPAPSDSEVNSNSSGRRRRSQEVDGLSVQRFMLLSRIHMARLTVDSFLLNTADVEPSDSAGKNKAKAGVRGKPPTPNTYRKDSRTYFVEYQFPVVATLRDNHQPNAMATEVVRVVSKNVEGKAVTFGRCSVFPVLFDEESIEKWWKSALIFKLYCRSGTQRVPVLLGMCSLPLKAVLKAKALFLGETVEVKDRSQGSAPPKNGQEADWPSIGQLKISVELATDSRDLQTALAKTQLAEMRNPKIIPIPRLPTKPRFPAEEKRKRDSSKGSSERQSSSGTQTEPLPTSIDRQPIDHLPEMRSRKNYHTPSQLSGATGSSSRPSILTADDYESSSQHLTLHMLLMAPEGSHVTLHGQPSTRLNNGYGMMQSGNNAAAGGDLAVHNFYLVSRMFWSEDVCRSNVCWGTADPLFNFVQMAPFLLTQSLLERMHGNFMIIEVYAKKASSPQDQLVGIVKLPLHQFYMSFRDRRISSALLKYPLPVISVDGEMPIVNPLTGGHHGHLKLLLALGSFEQVAHLHRNRIGGGSTGVTDDRPLNHLERIHLTSNNTLPTQYGLHDNMVEHIFEVVIEGVTGLKLAESMIWGEADCFVQYHFPSQTTANHPSGATLVQSGPILKTYRTNTTLCVQDLMFHHLCRHKMLLPEGTPVQKEILTACAGVGGGAGGILFELWFRYYNPNTREQIFAKALLPLAKLCAMVTMKKQGEASVQSFSLTLASLIPDDNDLRPDQEAVTKFSQCGSLDVTVHYRTNFMKGTSVRNGSSSTVCITVSVLRACGLKFAASSLAKHDTTMKYPSEVGVNSYVRVRLSFLQKDDERSTRTVARSFAPDFSSTMDFPCPLLWTDSGAEPLSLAEVLENAEAVFEVWHQTSATKPDAERHSGTIVGRQIVATPSDVLLGTVRVSLKSMITRRTSLSRWHPIHVTPVGWDSSSSQHDRYPEYSQSSLGNLDRIVGGLELKVAFAHEKDIDAVLDAGHEVGWSPFEDAEWENGDDVDERFCSVTVAVDDVCFPLTNALFAGQTKLDPSAACYVKYRLYDKKSVLSKSSSVEESDGFLRASVKHSKTQVVSSNSVFFRYLREELLEVEVMLTYGGEHSDRHARSQDRKIGSAFIDLESLGGHARDRQQRIRSTYPLFKPGSSSLGGACLTANITMKPCSAPDWYQSDDEDSNDVHLRRGGQMLDSHGRQTKDSASAGATGAAVDLEKVFPVHISIERAFHLPMVLENNVGMEPCAYVSYQTAEKSGLTCTAVVPSTTNPVWCHEYDTYLSRDLLTHKERNLIFKVWHKTGDVEQVPDKSVDRVLGFVSVDLSCLKNFGRISGCYNVIDVKGLCRGQLQVSIVPGQSVMLSDATDLALDHFIPSLSMSTAFIPGNTMWCSDNNYRQLSVSSGETERGLSENIDTSRFHHTQLQQLIDGLRNVDTKIKTLGKYRDTQEESTGPESEAMPLSTSSLLMTYGGSTLGTNTWGPVPTQPQEGTINPTTTYVKKSDGPTSSANSTTKDAMAQLLQQTLEKTGSTIVSFAAGDNGEPASTGRSDGESALTGRSDGESGLMGSGEGAVLSELGGDFSAALIHAQSLLQQFGPLIGGTLNGFDETPITIRAHDRVNFPDQANGEDPSKGDGRLGLRHTEEQLRGNLLESTSEFAGAGDDRRDEIPGSDFEEEDTFSNIWAMRSSQRRSSGESLDLTVVEATGESYVQPRTLNDVNVNDVNVNDVNVNDVNVGEQTNVESRRRMQRKDNPEEEEDAEEEESVSLDPMFLDLRDAPPGDAPIDIENEYLENESRLAVDSIDASPPSHRRRINTSPDPMKSSKIDQKTGRREVTHSENVGASPKSRSSWKAAMQRREDRQRERVDYSSGSDDGDDEHPISSRPQRRNLPNRDKTSRHSDSSQRATAVSESGNQEGGARSRVTPRSTNDDRLPVGAKAVPVEEGRRQLQIVERRVDPPPAPESKLDTERSGGGGTGRTAPPGDGQHTVSQTTLPNFFLPPADLAKTMRQLCGVKKNPENGGYPLPVEDDSESEKTANADMLQKLNAYKKTSTAKRIAESAKNLPQSTEQVQRIAKIFAGKFSS